MQILNIPLDKRDYCAHYFRAIMICTQQYWPSQYAYCEPERHAWEQCEIKKFVSIDENFEFCLVWFFSKTDDAKEYERELRLRRRRLRQEEAIRRDPTHQEIANNEE
jgi:hypothetical protein